MMRGFSDDSGGSTVPGKNLCGLPGRRLAGIPVALVAALLSATLGGCGTISGWFSSSKTKPADLVAFQTTLPVRQLWSVKIGGAEKYFFTPAVVDDKLAYAASADGTIAKIDLATGQALWRIRAGQDLSAGVGTDGELVVVVSNRGEVLAFDAAGKERWRSSTNSEIVSPPAVGGGVVVVRSTDSRFHAFDASTGSRRWGFQRQAQSLVLRIAPGMPVGNDLLYAGLPGGRLIALTLSNGSLRWDSSVATPKGATDLERVADVVGTPVLAKGNVCAVAYQGRAGCFEALNGYESWGREISSGAGLAIDQRFVFITDQKSALNALSSNNGTSVWRNDKLLYRGVGAPASVGRAVVAGDFKGILHWLSREDGSFMARTNTDGSPLTAQPIAFSSGTTPAVLVQTRAGNLFAFGAE